MGGDEAGYRRAVDMQRERGGSIKGRGAGCEPGAVRGIAAGRRQHANSIQRENIIFPVGRDDAHIIIIERRLANPPRR